MDTSNTKTFFSLSNGKQIPGIGLGTFMSEKMVVGKAVLTALKNGYRHIDCAASYMNEEEIGKEAFEPFFKEGTVTREQIFITTKLRMDRAHEVRQSCEDSLKKLHLAYLDLFLIHYPIPLIKGCTYPITSKDQVADIPIEQIWLEMEKLVDEGLVKSIGVSNFTIPQLQKLLSTCRIKPVVNQVEFNIYFQQQNLAPFCKKNNIHITAYCPLGNNSFALRTNLPSVFEDKILKHIAEKHNKTVAQVVLKFINQNGHSAIPKSVTKERIISNFNLYDFELDDKDFMEIKSLDRNTRVADFSFFYEALGLTHEEFWGEK
ncbi:Aldose reductase [Entamoeba marina]